MSTVRRRLAQTTFLATLLLIAGATLAQDSDPLAGTTIEALGSYTPSAAPDRALVFLRITMEPGTEIPTHHHPGAVVVVVESGVFGTRLVEGDGTITRFAGEGGEATTEQVTAGDEATLEAGDSFAYEGAMHTMANPGDEPLVLLVSALLDPEQPGFIFQNAQ
ncbi:MAG TPA: hypothetical protein VFD39_04620 [Trueperaceae bacterium]|nr:hypothetical protein [Trueperaceae bacterium]